MPRVLSTAMIAATCLLAAVAVKAELITYDEDFTSWQYRDAALSSAWWDTLAGEIKLYPFAMDERSTLATAGVAYDAAIGGTLVLVADADGGLVAVDVTDPDTPLETDVLETGGSARGIVLVNTVGYVANGAAGMAVVDATDPTDLTIFGALDLPGFAHGIATAGFFAYVAQSNHGLAVVRILDPSDPIEVAVVATGDWAQDVVVAGSFAYVADANAGLTVIDVSDPYAPTVVGNLPLTGYAFGVAIAGTLVYVAVGEAGLAIVDADDPAAPQLVGTLELDGTCRAVVHSGPYVQLAAGEAGLLVVEVTDPAHPILRGSLDADGDGRGLTIGNQLTYLADGSGGLRIVEVDPTGFDTAHNLIVSTAVTSGSDPIARARLACTGSDSVYWDLSVNAGMTWSPIWPDQEWFAFAEPGTTLHWRATLVYTGGAVGPSCNQLGIEYDVLHAYGDISTVIDVPDDDGGQIRVVWSASRFDAAGSETPITEYSVYRRFDETARSTVTGYALTGDNAAGGPQPPYPPPGNWDYLVTVPADAENQYAVVVPTLADSNVVGGMVWSVFFVRARTAEIGTYFDSPPDSGYSLDNLRPDSPTGFTVAYDAIDGNRLAWSVYPEPDFAHFRIYRSDDPQFLPGPGNLLQIVHETEYVDAADAGTIWYYRLTVVVLDGNESYPVAPTVLTSAPDADPETIPLGIHLLGGHPNPFNPTVQIGYTVGPTSQTVRLDIFDTRGRLLRTLADGPQPVGRHTVLWDGRDSAGRALPSGVYIARLQGAGDNQALKLTLAR